MSFQRIGGIALVYECVFSRFGGIIDVLQAKIVSLVFALDPGASLMGDLDDFPQQELFTKGNLQRSITSHYLYIFCPLHSITFPSIFAHALIFSVKL
jgi:hypothetical protein